MLRKAMISNRVLFAIGVFAINVVVQCKNDCWTSFNAKEHFKIMDALDDRYEKVRRNFQRTVGGQEFDNDMLVAMLKSRGIAERTLHEAQGNQNVIPAGINLGGYCMMKMPKAVLFFHRMKLRNSTVFRITDINNDFANLIMRASINLSDLHLFGSYDLTIATKPGYLAYEPTFGQVELLLKNVRYKMEGRYRFLKNKLSIELIISEVLIDDILMMYQTKNSTSSVKLHRKNINVFIERLQVDLDKWLKDYFNDYLMYYVAADDEEFLNYNREKILALNNFTDNAINTIIKRIHDIKADAVKLPAFTIFVTNDKEVRLRDGVLRGLDSIYRRAIATGTKDKLLEDVRKVDTVVGFSDLKLIYRYDAILKSGLPPVTGILILTADELTAHMGLRLVKSPDTADLSFRFLEQAKPETLTVEGPANRMISNFKYLLERHIIAIMSNTLMHNINMLGTLDKCVPLLPTINEQTEQNPSEENREDNMLVNTTGDIDDNISRDDTPLPTYEGSDEQQPVNSREDNMLVNITNFFEAALEKSNLSRDDSPTPMYEGSFEEDPSNGREDNMLVNISSSFEAALHGSNTTRDKTLIGVYEPSKNENTLRNFNYYHRRIPLKVIPLKRSVNHFKKSVKRNT
ncbi:uncharacterized protein LOC124534384 [Vanessa cardui]|uniref:uncharacterized protein LOC124534384 n=1 Tax=Vanessa cardui TaxID=171605 RepID=UPI001F141859|nr:uncharacterized protein LOC124534384 [Vanessa cardui]